MSSDSDAGVGRQRRAVQSSAEQQSNPTLPYPWLGGVDPSRAVCRDDVGGRSHAAKSDEGRGTVAVCMSRADEALALALALLGLHHPGSRSRLSLPFSLSRSSLLHLESR